MSRKIDLHLHTTCSDGLTPPHELLELVRQRGLAAFSITDHDTIEGYLQARDLLKENDPELVPGLELSCTEGEEDLHMLAYFYDPDSSVLLEALQVFHKKRNQRGRVMVQKLNAMGLEISFDDVLAFAHGAPVGRPHVAQTLLQAKKVITFDEAFRKYIGNQGPAYVPKDNLTPEEAVKLTHKAGGVAIVAHPIVSGVVNRIPELVQMGLDGIESHHPDHNAGETDRLRQMAKQLGVICTGGSDFHGRSGRCGTVGSEKVPFSFLEDLKTIIAKKRTNN